MTCHSPGGQFPTATAVIPSHLSTHIPSASKTGLIRVASVFLFSLATFLISGCAAIVQSATTTTTQTNGVVSVTYARSSIVALGDAKAVVDRVRATAGKTSSVGVSGVSEETTSTNIMAGVAEIVAAAVRAAKTP